MTAIHQWFVLFSGRFSELKLLFTDGRLNLNNRLLEKEVS